ncbi:MAG: NAD(+) synthase [Myxococcales bacterium]|nr:NAD(+) synthase [Myxococcales bacterium]
MHRVHVAVGILNQTPFAWVENETNLRGAIRDARAKGVTLLCLPELAITGYGCEDMFQSAGLQARAWEILVRLAAEETRGMVVTVGLPLEHRGAVYNCAALCVDGAVVGLVAKRFLAGDGIHYEPRWFKPWPEGVATTITRPDVSGAPQTIPIGDLAFDVGGLLLGFEICEDAWVAARPGARLARLGVDVILNPSASHFAFGKQAVRRQIVVEGSRAFGVTYLYANLLGNEAGRAIYDGGGIVACAGSPIAETTRFSFAGWQVASAIADVELTRLQRARSASFRPDVRDDGVVALPFKWPTLPAQRERVVELVDYTKEEAFARVMALGLFDYLRKSRSRGYVVSLSGGADSAACACLVRLMVELALAELGPEGVREKLAYVEDLPDDAAGITRRLLTTAYQATRNSSEVTLDAARAVAEACGADHHVLDVDALVQHYVSLAEGALGRPLSWDRDDLALQNIQARVRAPSVWMLANVRGQLLVATSNRSEAAVGYATMDGDTAGGISPIAGIDKAFLRTWLAWLEREGIAGVGPVPALAAVNVQPPTAELRPLGDAQTDEGDLMPYPILDAIERVAIRDKKMPAEAFDQLHAEHPEVEPEQLRAWVVKFYRLWSRNQWKRERYAPSFHVDDKNLDPKTWCRFPILSGGYALELAELEAAARASEP